MYWAPAARVGVVYQTSQVMALPDPHGHLKGVQRQLGRGIEQNVRQPTI